MEAEGYPQGLFLDTSAIVANLRSNDPHHAKAQALYKRISAREFKPLIISEFIFAEAVTVIGLKMKQTVAISLGKDLFNPAVYMVPASTIFKETWELFASQKTYQLSFVDCSILAAMEEVGVKKLATYDLALARFVKARGLDIEIVG